MNTKETIVREPLICSICNKPIKAEKYFYINMHFSNYNTPQSELKITYYHYNCYRKTLKEG